MFCMRVENSPPWKERPPQEESSAYIPPSELLQRDAYMLRGGGLELYEQQRSETAARKAHSYRGHSIIG
jgi:hypothetical protein